MIKEDILQYYYRDKESIDIDMLSEFEEKKKIKLPNMYKEFIVEYNGAELNYPIFDLEVNNKKYEVCIWSILGLKTENGLLWANDEYGEEIPNNFIIIGHGDGFIIMNCNTEKIFFWDDEYNLDISNHKQNVYEVANNFNEFINKLYIED